ncbi:MAG: single-stranded DNA-binding protein [Candidatus Odinarchaeota archaeon]
MSEENENVVQFITVEELKPNSKNVNLKVKVVSKTEPREVVSKLSGETLRVAEALVGDETASILLTLWNEDIDNLKDGGIYQINNGYVTLFKGSMRLNTGKYGSIEEITSEDFGTVNSDKNLSDQVFEQPRFRRPFNAPSQRGYGGRDQRKRGFRRR